MSCHCLGPPSENRWPDFLKTPEHPTELQLDIPYYHYGFAIEANGIQHEKYYEFFHRAILIILLNSRHGINSRKNSVKKSWITLRYVWYYEDPFEKIPDILQELGLIP